jgi:hypothetical protein
MTNIVIKNTQEEVAEDGETPVDVVTNRTFRCVMNGLTFQAWLQNLDGDAPVDDHLYMSQPWKCEEDGSRSNWADLAEALAWFKTTELHEEG